MLKQTPAAQHHATLTRRTSICAELAAVVVALPLPTEAQGGKLVRLVVRRQHRHSGRQGESGFARSADWRVDVDRVFGRGRVAACGLLHSGGWFRT